MRYILSNRNRTAARNLTILRKVAINLMGRDRTLRISMRACRKQAARNDDYILSLLVAARNDARSDAQSRAVSDARSLRRIMSAARQRAFHP